MRCALPITTGIQKNTAQSFQDDIARELERLVAHIMADGHRRGHVDLEATELAIRAAMHEIGGRLLEKLLNADAGGGPAWPPHRLWAQAPGRIRGLSPQTPHHDAFGGGGHPGLLPLC